MWGGEENCKHTDHLLCKKQDMYKLNNKAWLSFVKKSRPLSSNSKKSTKGSSVCVLQL